MKKSRLEAFSDGVIAIIITIMVLELKIPHGDSPADLGPLLPVFISYILSFIYVGIYWNNHHHLWMVAEKVDGRILWANLHLLFWLSLFPFATGWMGENHFSTWPVILYGCVTLMAAVAWYILARCVIRANGKESDIAQAYNRDFKGKISIVIYLAAIACAWRLPWASFLAYALVAALWIVPDRRVEKQLRQKH